MRKQGMTLIELIVAITLFMIVVTLATGGFIAISRLKSLMIDMKNNQQKGRLIYETIYRSAKEATAITIDNSGDWVVLNFSDTSSTKAFSLTTVNNINEFNYYTCTEPLGDMGQIGIDPSCSHEDLLASPSNIQYKMTKDKDSNPIFVQTKSLPTTLSVRFSLGNNKDTIKPFEFDNMIILESVR